MIYLLVMKVTYEFCSIYGANVLDMSFYLLSITHVGSHTNLLLLIDCQLQFSNETLVSIKNRNVIQRKQMKENII